MSDPYLRYLERPTRERYTQFVLAYAAPVQRLVKRLVSSDDLAEDVIQETFLRLGKARKRPEEMGNPRSYVLQAAFHLAKHHVRGAEVRAGHEEKAGRLRSKLNPPASEEAIAKESIRRLHDALDSLPTPLRAAMHLRAMEGLSYQEISVVTGCSVNAVRAQVCRARKRLRLLLGKGQLELVLLNLKELGPEAWLPERAWNSLPARAVASQKTLLKGTLSPPVKAGLPMSLSVVCLCVGVLGFFYARDRSGFSQPGYTATTEIRPERQKARSGGETQDTPNARGSEGAETQARGPEQPTRGKVIANRLPSNALTEKVRSQARTVLPHPQEGDADMLMKSSLASAFVALGISAVANGAEPGDADGDGRLTIGDAAWLQAGDEPAPGSLDAYDVDPCLRPSRFVEEDFRLPFIVAPNLLMEVVRRAVPGSLPHWDPALDPGGTSPPLPVDPRIKVRVEDIAAPGGSEDNVQVVLAIENTVTVTHFLLLLEADQNILRERSVSREWDDEAWRKFLVIGESGDLERDGDVPVAVGPGPILITQGKLALTFGFRRLLTDIDRILPGTHSIIVNARLPLGTAAGRYGLRVLPTSEVRLDDGTVISPTVEKGGELSVGSAVQVGWDEGPVPLQTDPVKKEVLGDIEFRLTDAEGLFGDDAVFQGQAGDAVKIRVQVRTDVPLNDLSCALTWPQGKLFCDGFPILENLFTNPEDGELYPFNRQTTECNQFAGALRGSYILPGFLSNFIVAADLRYPERILEYFKPLGQWTDLFEVAFKIGESAGPGEQVPIELFLPLPCSTRPGPGSPVRYACEAQFHPYQRDWHFPCVMEMWPQECNWTYPGLKATGAKVLVLEGPPPPPPPDYEITIRLGDAEGRPGEVVDMPVFASATVGLDLLRLVLELDPTVAVVELVELRVTNQEQVERTESLHRGDFRIFRDCFDRDGDGVPEDCSLSVPVAGQFNATEKRFLFLDILSQTFDYPGNSPSKVAVLKVQIEENPGAPETELKLVNLKQTVNGFETEVISGGRLYPAKPELGFSPAKSFEGGKIRVLGFQERGLLRGDANRDSKVDLSDAVTILGYLFLGNTGLSCLDAADADDSGGLSITDPIFLLGFLFLGRQSIPEPYPACGTDPTTDELGCRQGCP